MLTAPSAQVVIATLRVSEPLVALSDKREALKGGGEALDCGRPGPGEAAPVGQLRPVVGMGDPCPVPVDGVEFPTPQMARRLSARYVRAPCDQAALNELDDCV